MRGGGFGRRKIEMVTQGEVNESIYAMCYACGWFFRDVCVDVCMMYCMHVYMCVSKHSDNTIDRVQHDVLALCDARFQSTR